MIAITQKPQSIDPKDTKQKGAYPIISFFEVYHLPLWNFVFLLRVPLCDSYYTKTTKYIHENHKTNRKEPIRFFLFLRWYNLSLWNFVFLFRVTLCDSYYIQNKMQLIRLFLLLRCYNLSLWNFVFSFRVTLCDSYCTKITKCRHKRHKANRKEPIRLFYFFFKSS